MREPTIARNYAEALFAVGEKTGDTQRFGDLLDGFAGAMGADPRVRIALESPSVAKSKKQTMISSALAGKASDQFIRFLHAVVKRGRQGIIPAISREYLGLVDVKFNRVHAGITLAREADIALQQEIKDRLTASLGQEVMPHYRIDPSIVGGLIVRVGDRVLDGSLRRKMLKLRRRMLQGAGLK